MLRIQFAPGMHLVVPDMYLVVPGMYLLVRRLRMLLFASDQRCELLLREGVRTIIVVHHKIVHRLRSLCRFVHSLDGCTQNASQLSHATSEKEQRSLLADTNSDEHKNETRLISDAARLISVAASEDMYATRHARCAF